MRMTLGAYTMARNPNRVSALLTPVRHTATVQTYGGVAFFSWGHQLSGKKVSLEWNYCQIAQYNAMETLFLTDAPMLWNPMDGSRKKYEVEITSFDGQLFMFLQKNDWWRKDVRMELIILDEGVAI